MRHGSVFLALTGFALLLGALPAAARLAASGDHSGSIEGFQCHVCHAEGTPGLVEQWRMGVMGQRGVNCFDCHGADPGDPDAMEHYGHRIAVLVTPLDCGRCHPREAEEQSRSGHARAAATLESRPTTISLGVFGRAAAAVGCDQCHGSRVLMRTGGSPYPSTWPNSGVGRINPDGSRGSCSSCHSRHRFSRAEARRPQACAKCHTGAGQPQLEVYRSSKHGALFETFADRMGLERPLWRAGIEYSDAPTCATCHLGRVAGGPPTHDVSARLSWNLQARLPVRHAGAAEGRAAMRQVCHQCHDAHYADDFFRQADAAVELDRDQFAAPAQAVVAELRAAGKLTPNPYDEPLEWTYRDFWRRAERRARLGAVMNSPSSTWDDGFSAVAEQFYGRFLPEARTAAGPELWPGLHTRVLGGMAEHRWLLESPPP